MNRNYWKKYYVVEGDADAIEADIKRTNFVSDGKNFELIYVSGSSEGGVSAL